MENKIELPNPQKKQFLTFAIISFIFFAIYLGFFIFLCVDLSNTSMDKVTIAQGVVSEVTLDDNSETFNITLSDGETYQITSVITEHLQFEELEPLVNGNVTLHLYHFGANTGVIGIDSDTYNLSVDQGFAYVVDNLKTGILVTGIMTALGLVCAIVCFILYKKAKQQKTDDILSIFAMMYNPLTKERKNYIKWSLISMALLFIVLLPITIVMGYTYGETTPFFITLGIFVASFTAWMVIVLGYLPKIRLKDIDSYTEKYNFENKPVDESMLDDGFVEERGEGLIYKFTDTHLIFNVDDMLHLIIKEVEESYKDVQSTEEFDKDAYLDILKDDIRKDITDAGFSDMKFDYNELNFYIRVIFRPTGETNAFVVSNVNEAFKQSLKKDMIFELNEVLYHYIKKYNITVKGLTYFLEHRKELMLKNCKGNIKYIPFEN